MPAVHFGVTVPQIRRSWEETKRAATAFESMGFDSLWVSDHLYGPQSPAVPILEAWSLVSALAAVTERVQIGTLVTPIGMRNPAHLGKVVATVDNISGGRIIPGLGAGWMAREFSDFGVPFLSAVERLGQLREGVQLLTQMWDPELEAVTFQGTYFQVDELVCQPKPQRRLPLLIGGAGERRTLRIAAEYADIWNNPAVHQTALEHKIHVLRQHCDALGRDPAAITISQQCLVTIAPDADSLGPMVDKAQRLFAGHLGDPAGPLAITGTPEQVRDRIRRHLDLGCTMLMIEFFGRDTVEPARLFAETVMPHFR